MWYIWVMWILDHFKTEKIQIYKHRNTSSNEHMWPSFLFSNDWVAKPSRVGLRHRKRPSQFGTISYMFPPASLFGTLSRASPLNVIPFALKHMIIDPKATKCVYISSVSSQTIQILSRLIDNLICKWHKLYYVNIYIIIQPLLWPWNACCLMTSDLHF